jgi:hypothetical protein
MFHARQRIREAATAQLTGLTAAYDHVYAARVHPLSPAGLPAILVFTNQEQVISESEFAPREQRRTLELVIEAYARLSADVDDQLDQIAAEVETAIAGDVTLGGTARDCELISINTDLFGEGDQFMGLLTLTYHVLYFTTEGAPTVALD